MSVAYAKPDEIPSSSSFASISPGPSPTVKFAGVVLVAALAGTSSTIPFRDAIHVTDSTRTVRSPNADNLEADPQTQTISVPTSDQDLVKWVKEHSGLTWDQLGRVFGVSRRAVHMWASGARVNSANAESLREFALVVQSVLGDDPQETRAALLSMTASGRSLTDEFRRRLHDQRVSVSGTPFSPTELLGSNSKSPLT